MGYAFPQDFPHQSRARIESTKIQAGMELDESKRHARWLWDVEYGVRKYILRIFLTFAEEALELGREGLWTVDRIDNELHEFLWSLTVEAQFYKGHDKWGEPIRPLVDRVFSRILPEVRREFEESMEWRRYQEGLLKVCQLQSSTRSAESSPQYEVVDTRGRAKAEGALADASRRSGPKPLRRRPKDSAVDVELRRIAESRPESHEDVFDALDGRVNVPRAKPFANAGGWVNGFKRDKPAARAWLSRAWTRLGLPPFRRGPKK